MGMMAWSQAETISVMSTGTVARSGVRRSDQAQQVAEAVAAMWIVTATALVILTICSVETSAKHRKSNIPSLVGSSAIVEVVVPLSGATTGMTCGLCINKITSRYE